MNRRILESLDSTVHAVFREQGSIVWESRAVAAASEVAGDPAVLLG